MVDRADEGAPGSTEAFASGLRAILARADVGAFRRYLGRWEEFLGDTSSLATQTDDEVRRTMAEMLRRPRQFGLPAWPTDDAGGGTGVGASQVAGGGPDGGVAPASLPGEASSCDRVQATDGASGADALRARFDFDQERGEAASAFAEPEALAILPLPGVDPVDAPAGVYDEVAWLDGHDRRHVSESAVSWRQANFVTGTLVDARGRVPRVVSPSRGGAGRRPGPRLPAGYTQLDLPFGGEDR